MKYHFGIKLAAFLLAACMLVLLVGSGLTIIFLSSQGLYTGSVDNWVSHNLESRACDLADDLLRRYTARDLGKLTREQLVYCNRGYSDGELSDLNCLTPSNWDYWITDMDGNRVASNIIFRESSNIVTFTFTMSCDYPVHATLEESWVIEYESDWLYRDYYYTETEEHFLYYYTSPTYQVTVRILPSTSDTYDMLSPGTVEMLFSIRYLVIAALGISLLVFILAMVYLCFAAGRTPTDPEARLRGLCKLPLDLTLVVTLAGCYLFAFVAFRLLEDLFVLQTNALDAGVLSLAGFAVFGAALLLVGYLYTFAAQSKQKNGTWWRRSIIGFLLCKIGRVIRLCFRAVRRLFSMLPLIWQWLLTAAAMVLVPLIFQLLMKEADRLLVDIVLLLWFITACLADIGMVCYGAYAFGLLIKGAKRMAMGNLHEKVPTKHLFGAFRDFANALNALADAATVAARNQMKSERMKTELITNVSHDIKTPLTSLINYVDLLQSPHTEEEGQQYLDVLARQSARMKKLIDDLMDMSKASTGNMAVEISQLDASETVNQALGEFADKLSGANLTPVFRPEEAPVTILADGRLTWRVLSNLLSNVVKYAMPGTRVYVDLVQLDSCVQVSLKNISAEPLNVSADELTERFVRGDASRNTDGSGLGLNIAKSLMELQKGSLELLVDGDLFKVTLTFPTE